MTFLKGLACKRLAFALFLVPVYANPVDFTYGLITGAHINSTATGVLSQGTQIEYPIWDWIQDKSYTSRVVQYTHTEKDESYVGFGPTRDYGFSSGEANGLGDIEVGVTNPIRRLAYSAAVSRYNFKIKNNLDEPIAYLFEFAIDRGFLEVSGIRSDHTAHARVEAMIDYVLLSPAGPFGGHYDETTGSLFNYYADVSFDNRLTHSSNANVTLIEKNDFNLLYVIDPYYGKIWLPEIPARGEITVYYDMYAHLNIQRFEIGGKAMLGDPNSISGGPGIRLTRVQPEADVPEPASSLLFAMGAISLGATSWIRRRR